MSQNDPASLLFFAKKNSQFQEFQWYFVIMKNPNVQRLKPFVTKYNVLLRFPFANPVPLFFKFQIVFFSQKAEWKIP